MNRRLVSTAVVSLLGMLAASTAYAACTNDNECKGDRICVDGQCVDPATVRPTGVPVTTPAPHPTPAYVPAPVVAPAPVATPAPAPAVVAPAGAAKELRYGTAGVKELGGSVNVASRTTTYKGGGKVEELDVFVTPRFGYFVTDRIEVLADVRVDIHQRKSGGDKQWNTLVEIGAGGAYMIPSAKGWFGPVAVLRYIQDYDEFTTAGNNVDYDTNGTGITIGAVYKLPVGTRAFVNLSLEADYNNLSTTVRDSGVSFSYDAKETVFRPTIGMSAMF